MCSGFTAPSVEQQLATYKSHVKVILSAMKAAVKWVTHLHLRIHHTQHPSNVTEQEPITTHNEVPCTAVTFLDKIPESMEPVIGELLQAFAASVPHVHTLSLEGACGESSVQAFGSLCPQLSSLAVDVETVPVIALQHISNHLPHLTRLTLRAVKQSNLAYGGFVDATMVYLQACERLTVLDLEFNGSLMLCRTKCWNLAPASLENFTCNAVLFPEAGLMPHHFCSRLKRLTTAEHLGRTNLQQFLLRYPRLQELNILHPESVELLCCGNINATEDLLMLRERFAAGFKLTCKRVGLWGSSEEVRDALEWLPPLPSVKSCSLNLSGTVHVDCLQQLARVFPNLDSVFMSDEELEAEEFPLGTDAEFFTPLLACTGLAVIHVLMHVRFTTKWLFKLCQGLPALEQLKYVPCQGVSHTLLRLALPLVDLDIGVEEYPPSAFHVDGPDGNPVGNEGEPGEDGNGEVHDGED